MQHRVSVIIPTYNRAHLIARALRSVLAATSRGDEVIVVDDGSTDGTAAVVKSFGASVRYVRIPNSGPGAARNVGIRLASNPLVTFLDSDDEWVKDKLELQRAVMAKYPDVVFCFSNLLCRMPSGEMLHDILSLWRQTPTVGSLDAPHLSSRLGPGQPYSSIAPLPKGRADFNVHIGDMYLPLMEVLYVSGIAVMVRKDQAGPLFRNEEHTRLMEDWWCYARMAKRWPAAYLDCELAIQNVHNGFRLTRVDDVKQATMRLTVLQQVWGSDDAFQKTHADRYQQILRAQHLFRARVLLSMGRVAEARVDLAALGGGPLLYRLLAKLPAPIVRGVLDLRRSALGRGQEVQGA